MWSNRILWSPGSRKNCRVRSSPTGGPEVRRGLRREESSQAEAKEQGREAVEGLFLCTLSPRASLAYGTALDRESQPIVNQGAEPPELGHWPSFSASWAASTSSSELLRGSAGPREPRKSLEMLPQASFCLALSGSLLLPFREDLYSSHTWPRALRALFYQILIAKAVENAS